MSRVNQSVVQNVDIQPKSFPCQVSGISTVVLGDSLAPSPSSPHPLSLSSKGIWNTEHKAGYDSDERYIICFSVMELT